MGIFNRSVDPDELRASMSEERLDRDATVYQASRGGHFPAAREAGSGHPAGRAARELTACHTGRARRVVPGTP